MDQPLSLRQALRQGTRGSHDRLDASFSALDPGRRSSFAVFLQAQLAALARLSPADSSVDAAQVVRLREEMTAALAADLAALAAPMPALPPRLVVGALPLLYVLRGSRMGTQIIARRWSAAVSAGTAETAAAGRYLTLDPQADEWRALCLRLQDRPGNDAAGRRAVAAAAAVFDHFATALALNPPASRPQPTPEPANV